MFSAQDVHFMQHAIALAKQGAQAGEVPVGAIVVVNNEIVGQAYNSPINKHDPSAHAEILALRDAGQTLKNYRLVSTTLYVTLEPCMMCVGALVHARIEKLIFGAYDKRAGCVERCGNFLDQTFLNHRVQYQGGLLEQECGALLSQFFKLKRAG